MKDINYLLPEMSVMVKLLKLIEKSTLKISKMKTTIRRIEELSRAVQKLQKYNFERFSFIRLYQQQCKKLYEEDKDFTYSFYQERFNDDYVKACFMDEANCLSLIKSAKVPGWNCDPSSPDFSFYLNYYILETLDFNFNPDYVRNCMDYFVPDNRTLDKYRKGVTDLFYKKKRSVVFSDDYDKEETDDLLVSVNSIFSMKCGVGDYIPVFEPCPDEDAKVAKDKRETSVLKLTNEDLDKFGSIFTVNPHGRER